jgi:putative tricarboxylic transport membrane protein
MNCQRRVARHFLAAGSALSILAAAAAVAQPAWRPDRPVEIVVPTAAGGSNDVIARVVQKIVQGEKLAAVPINAINRVGGNQTLSRVYVSQHPGDAHFLHVDNPTVIANHITGVTQLHHGDFTPIALLVSEYTVLAVRPDSPLRNARDLVDQLKKDPESVGIGVSNRGGNNHLALSLLAKSAGVDPKRLKMVVFKSNTESATAVQGGHLQMSASAMTSLAGHVAAGRMRIIAVGAPQRSTGLLATVPTLREQGYDISLANWRAISGPKGLSAPQVIYWEDTLAKVVATDEWKKALETQYWDPSFLRSREYAKHLDSEYAVTKAILAELGLAK